MSEENLHLSMVDIFSGCIYTDLRLCYSSLQHHAYISSVAHLYPVYLMNKTNVFNNIVSDRGVSPIGRQTITQNIID